HLRRADEMLAGAVGIAGAAVELAQAEMAVSDERAHAVQLGERHCLPVVSCTAFGFEPIGVGRDIAEKAERMGLEARIAPGGLHRTTGQAPRLPESTEQQIGATQRVVGPAAMADESPCRLTLEELLGLPGAA